ncbi:MULTISPECIES: CFI-box-CTERM domain-containing protein [Aerosakkonema]|uniref:CFI-box-CTERM domain-containing protein n=1 Tax=Aerosakkonema TaxID=1246629 RepID=UPI0035BA942E
MAKGDKYLSYFDGPHGRIRDIRVENLKDGSQLLIPFYNDSDPQKRKLHHHLYFDSKTDNAIGIAYITQDRQGKWRKEYWIDEGYGWKGGDRKHSDSYDSLEELYAAFKAKREIRKAREFAQYLAVRLAITFDEVIDSLAQDTESSSSSCFIATAAYSTSTHPDLDTFREFRDRKLLSNRFGKQLVIFYYKVSPTIATYISNKPALKVFIRHYLEHLARRMRS